MCRAVWGLAVGPDQNACNAIRRAAGTEVEIVAMAATPKEARERASELPLDVAVIDASTADAYGVVSALVRRPIALVWVGKEPPHNVHISIGTVDEDLPGAVRRAILARRKD
jgi:hypothetical protein